MCTCASGQISPTCGSKSSKDLLYSFSLEISLEVTLFECQHKKNYRVNPLKMTCHYRIHTCNLHFAMCLVFGKI